jgi:23S rRNA (guanosine2251-2'-O)-methyltransferase
MRQIVLIIHDVRSAHNVGSLLRTAEGLGIKEVLISGYSPYPPIKDDGRLPHLAQKTGRQIAKTALGAEDSISWRHIDDLAMSLDELSARDFVIAALEQTDVASLKLAGIHLAIPMLGRKESFNVSAAAAMALYHLRYS